MMTSKTVTYQIKDLATPKSLPAGFSEDRRSVYWENEIPKKDYTKTTTFALTPRQNQLVYSKRLHPEYQRDRSSPIWPISPSAMTATPSQRITQLAQSKRSHPDYRPCRQVMTEVLHSALLTLPSERVQYLARHKTFSPLPIKGNSEWEWGEWENDISSAAKNATASAHVVSLATPKQTHSLYRPAREVQWPVSKQVRSHNATERTHKLARPKNRNAHLEDYDPKAWSVPVAALHAKPTPRLEELATPRPRKVRMKKIV